MQNTKERSIEDKTKKLNLPQNRFAIKKCTLFVSHTRVLLLNKMCAFKRKVLNFLILHFQMLFTRPVKLLRRLLRSSWPLPLVLKSLHGSAHCFFPIWNPWTYCCTRNNLLSYRDHFSFTGRTENSHSPNFDHGVTLYDACNLLV